jgi:uncharacterized repeat protein (TIGR01451 family)
MRKLGRYIAVVSGLAALTLALLTGHSLAAASLPDAAGQNDAASLSVSASVSPDPMIIGGDATYSVTTKNNGGTAAGNPTTTITLPQGVTVDPATPLPAGCTTSGQVVTCTQSSLDAGSSVTYDIPVKVSPSLSDGTNLRLEARAQDGTGASGSATLISVARTQVDVEISKSGPATVNADGTITYTLTVTNNGPSDAPQVVVHDATNGNLTTITGLPPECPASGLTVTCNLGTLGPGETRTFTFTVKANPGIAGGTPIPNCAVVDVGKPDTVPDNNISCLNTIVGSGSLPIANLTVTKSAPATVDPDGTIHYTVTVTNRGPNPAENVVISDPLNVPLDEASSLPDGCAASGGTVTCQAGTLAVGETKTYEFTVKLGGTVMPGTNILNCAAAISHNTLLRILPYACAQTVVKPPPPNADVTVAKSGPATVDPDGTITYTFTVSNNGPDAAADVVVRDPLGGLPVTVTSLPEGCEPADGTVTCRLGTVAAGEHRTIEITVTADPDAVPGTPIENCSAVDTVTGDPDPGNNDSCTSTVVSPAPPQLGAFLSVVKTGPATVRPGGIIHYTVTVTNHGPAPADDVTVNDPADAPLDELVSVPAGCTLAGSTARCRLGTLAVGETRTLSFEARAAAGDRPGTNIMNTATATSGSELVRILPASTVETLVEAEQGHKPKPRPAPRPRPRPAPLPVVPVTG